jgi:rod shape-determining protein MreC
MQARSERSIRGHIVTYALLVALSLLLLAFSDTAQLQEVRRGVTFAFAPIQETLSAGARAVSDIFGAVAEIESLKRRNRELEAKVAELEQQSAQVPALQARLARLAELLKLKRSLSYQTVAAFVVGRASTLSERVITIDKGADDGVEVNDAVLAPGGAMVGAVAEVTATTATVRLLSDTRSVIIGRDVQTRATGEVRGKLSAPLSMEKIPGTARLAEGDSVVTAELDAGRGIRSLYPPDLVIGTVVDVLGEGRGLIERQALVQPAADLDALEAVLVVTSYRAPNLDGPAVTPRPRRQRTPAP